MITSTLDVQPVELDDVQLRRFHEIAWRAETQDGRPWNQFRTLREPTGDMGAQTFAAFEPGGDGPGRMVGAGIVRTFLSTNLDKAEVLAFVEPELRGRGIGGALVAWVRVEFRTQALSETAVPHAERDSSPMLRFASRHGFRVANVEVVRRLSRPLPAGLLDAVAAETAGHDDGFTVESYVDEVPSATWSPTAVCSTCSASTPMLLRDLLWHGPGPVAVITPTGGGRAATFAVHRVCGGPMFWLVAAGLSAAGAALAWWTSGRAKPGKNIQRQVDIGTAESKTRSLTNGERGPS